MILFLLLKLACSVISCKEQVISSDCSLSLGVISLLIFLNSNEVFIFGKIIGFLSVFNFSFNNFLNAEIFPLKSELSLIFIFIFELKYVFNPSGNIDSLLIS